MSAVAFTAPMAMGQIIPAFPGAEGFGADTPGGRGGTVWLVTTLEDYGEGEAAIDGSLRQAIEAEGARMILFRVAGYIDLKRPLVIGNPYLTIAGQSAPGDGVAIRNYGIVVEAPHVVMRYLRVWPGDVSGEELDAIDIRAGYVVVDHCSVGWGTDEVLSVTGGATNVTIQYTLIAESLNESVHHKGAHGYGTLIDLADSVTIHHTVYALHRSRNPRPKDALLDFRHNLIYGWGDAAGYNIDDRTRLNYVGNHLHPLAFSRHAGIGFHFGGGDSRVFAQGNTLDGAEVNRQRDLFHMVPEDIDIASILVDEPFVTPDVTSRDGNLVDYLLDEVGAVLPRRDGIDRRIIRAIRSGEGRIIDSQFEVGGWPRLEAAEAPLDSDGDGMPDGWEIAHGLDPHDPSDASEDPDSDGYTNLEEYLNGTDPFTPDIP